MTDDARKPALPSAPEVQAFVVQLQRGDRTDDADLRGRVEHLASGAETRFGSADDLLAFLRRVVAKPDRER